MEIRRDFRRRMRRKNRSMFVKPQNVAFGGKGGPEGKERELKEPLVSPAVCRGWNIWCQGFPKMSKDRK